MSRNKVKLQKSQMWVIVTLQGKQLGRFKLHRTLDFESSGDRALSSFFCGSGFCEMVSRCSPRQWRFYYDSFFSSCHAIPPRDSSDCFDHHSFYTCMIGTHNPWLLVRTHNHYTTAPVTSKSFIIYGYFQSCLKLYLDLSYLAELVETIAKMTSYPYSATNIHRKMGAEWLDTRPQLAMFIRSAS